MLLHWVKIFPVLVILQNESLLKFHHFNKYNTPSAAIQKQYSPLYSLENKTKAFAQMNMQSFVIESAFLTATAIDFFLWKTFCTSSRNEVRLTRERHISLSTLSMILKFLGECSGFLGSNLNDERPQEPTYRFPLILFPLFSFIMHGKTVLFIPLQILINTTAQ